MGSELKSDPWSTGWQQLHEFHQYRGDESHIVCSPMITLIHSRSYRRCVTQRPLLWLDLRFELGSENSRINPIDDDSHDTNLHAETHVYVRD